MGDWSGFDVSNPLSPQIVFGCNMTSADTRTGALRTYVVSAGMHSLQISQYGPKQDLDQRSWRSVCLRGPVWVRKVLRAEGRLYCEGQDGLTVYDVSDPGAPAADRRLRGKLVCGPRGSGTTCTGPRARGCECSRCRARPQPSSRVFASVARADDSLHAPYRLQWNTSRPAAMLDASAIRCSARAIPASFAADSLDCGTDTLLRRPVRLDQGRRRVLLAGPGSDG